YPNEHIARSTVEEIKSPMYATGIGLVIKALHAIDTGKHGSQPDAKPQKQQRTLGLFDKILQKGRNWLENDIEDSDYLRCSRLIFNNTRTFPHRAAGEIIK